MKRFFETASARQVDGGYEILLDGRPVKTPARSELIVPSVGLAEAIAAEWNSQGEKIDPLAMPLTGLANAAIDRVAPDREGFARGLALWGESDLLYYRASEPEALVRRQAEHWDPLLAWARRRFDVNFEVVAGIMHRAQPETTLQRLAHSVATYDSYRLAAFSPLVTIGGSLIIALALAEAAVTPEAAWAAATVDESWQTEQWGEDAEAAARLESRRRDFEAAWRFLNLL